MSNTKTQDAPHRTQHNSLAIPLIVVAIAALALILSAPGYQREAAATSATQDDDQPTREFLVERGPERHAMVGENGNAAMTLNATRRASRAGQSYWIRFWRSGGSWEELSEADCRSLLEFLRTHEATAMSRDDAVRRGHIRWATSTFEYASKDLVSGEWQVWDSTGFGMATKDLRAALVRALEQALSDLDKLRNAPMSHKPTL